MSARLISPKLLHARNFANAGCAVLPVFEPAEGSCACGNQSCNRAGKHPRTSDGVHGATTDLDLVERWWRRWPNANIGIATGRPSNLFVLDVDGDEGRASLASLTAIHGPLTDDARVSTGNGDHYYFRYGPHQIGNSAGRIGPGLDIRGDGGYVIAPGSRHVSGKFYRTHGWGQGRCTLKCASAPPWLIERASSPRPPDTHFTASIVEAERGRNYAEAARREELDRLRAAPDGQRNATLNSSAFRLGQLVAPNLLDVEAVTAELTDVARQIGLNEAEIGPTIRSGLEAGQRTPRNLEHLKTVPSSLGVPVVGGAATSSPSAVRFTV